MHRWTLAVERPGAVEELARSLSAAYVPVRMRSPYSDHKMATRLPTAGNVRTGDFGEFLASVLFERRFGETVPYQKLATKPVANATQQGTDVLAVTLVLPDHEPLATVVEVKTRSRMSPKADLEEIRASLGRIDDTYLRSAWAVALQQIVSNPNHKRAYARLAAETLSTLSRPTEPLPPHHRQAVIVTDRANLKESTVTEHWTPGPPVTDLHVIDVPGLSSLVDAVYDAAGTLTYGDVDGGVPNFLRNDELSVGMDALASSDAPASLAKAQEDRGLSLVIEASLWALAEWDGMALARARMASDADGPIGVLAQLIMGHTRRAALKARGDGELESFVHSVSQLWSRKISLKEFLEASVQIQAAVCDTDYSAAIHYTAASIAARHARHPLTLLEHAGATGPRVVAVAERAREGRGIQALWPSQAQALTGGLLDRGHRSLAVKMPTSAGKTLLIELLVADALDRDPEKVVAVVAPSRALVRQLATDLRRALPDERVRSVHGGLDFDTDDVTTEVLAEAGVVVMTPERLDLEWRRAVTGDVAIPDVGLLVVDEAHLVVDTTRGARLETVIARSLRRGIRVVLLSGQFPPSDELGEWLGSPSIESTWSPSWLHRLIYCRNTDKTQGLLVAEDGTSSELFPLVTSSKAGPGVCVRQRVDEAAALAMEVLDQGLVVVYSDKRARMDKLSTAIRERLQERGPVLDSELAERIGRLEQAYPDECADLRIGLAAHHGMVAPPVRRVVEDCARRGLLRCVVCTSSLLEGIDFPTKTVICAYPPEDDHGKPLVRRLGNLAGRAGRGGRYPSGTVIVMVDSLDKVQKWRRAFAEQLPATRSTLTAALRRLRLNGHALGVVDSQLADADALVIEALAEGATIDGDLRVDVERVLAHTLWYSHAVHEREAVLGAAHRRAQQLQAELRAGRWTPRFYKTGLPLASCLALQAALDTEPEDVGALLLNPAVDPTRLLIWLAAHIAPRVPELRRWLDYEEHALTDAFEKWVAGEGAVAALYPDMWERIERDLDGLAPWILTAIVEFALPGDLNKQDRATAHARVGIARLRYGVPYTELCPFVRRGEDRVRITELACQYDQISAVDREDWSLGEYVAVALKADEQSVEAPPGDEPW